MDIVIFKELTTNDYLAELQVEADKYTGLYVDMDNAPERKYVKDKANDIKQLLKKIDRKRIDASKEFKVKVEKEAAIIIEKLKAANEPFTLLIDAHNLEQANIRAEEKRINDERVAALQLIDDHEDAIRDNRLFNLESGERERLKVEQIKKAAIEREEYAAQQVKLAEERQKQLVIDAATKKTNDENARLADINHVRSINRAIFISLTNAGLDKESAQLATQALMTGSFLILLGFKGSHISKKLLTSFSN